MDSTTVIDADGSPTTTGTSSVTLNAVTAVAAKTLLVAIVMANKSASLTHPIPGAPPGAWQTIVEDDFDDGTASSGIWIGYLVLTASGSTGTKVAPISPAGSQAAGVMFTLNPAVVCLADAGPDQTGLEPYAAGALDGSGSTARSGHSLTYKWTPPAEITLSSTTVQKPTFTVPADPNGGSYEIQLVVNDGAGDSVPDTVTITALPQTIGAVRDGAMVAVKAEFAA
jgi:hypothetical protein